MKRTHPIFNLTKESSGARPQRSSGSQAQKPKNSKKGGGFLSSPTNLSTISKEFPSAPAASNGSERRCDPTLLPATKCPPKRRCSQILDGRKGVVNEESNSNGRWACPSTSTEAKPKPHISLELKVYKGSPKASPSKQPERQIRIPMPSPKRSNSKKNCCKRLRQRATGVRKGVRRIWDIMMAKKRVWDAWNPDKTHPIAACIDETKLAGLKETIKPNKGICYRIMWLLLFCIALSIGTTMSINAYKFKQENPVLFAFDTKEVPVEKLPPPGFTTCPHAAFKASYVTEAISKFSASEKEQKSNPTGNSRRNLKYYSRLLYFMSHMCEPKTIHSSRHGKGYYNEFTDYDYSKILKATEMEDSVTDDELTNKIIPFLKQASPNCEEMVKYCSWNTQSGDSCKFKPTFETTGGCCSFNRLPDSALHKGKRSLKTLWANEGTGKHSETEQSKKWNNWSLHKHLRHMNDPNSGEILEGPLRQASGGWPWGVSFVVTMDEKDSDCPQFDGSGTRVAISVPGVDVDVERESVLVPPKHEVFIRVFPEVTIADEDLKTISYEKRGCYMEQERNLTFYNNYNQENCHRECVAEFVLKSCGCVLLSFPNSADQKVCNVHEFECVREAEGALVRELKLSKVCPHCLPTCSHMTLRLETSMTPFSSNHVSEMARSVTGNSSLVHSFYGPKSIIAKVRKLRHSKYELYSEVGSIYETTNDMSLLGYVRIFVGVTITVTAYITYHCVRSFCRNRNIRIFDLQRRLIAHPIRRRQKARVRVADVQARGGDSNVATAAAQNPTSTSADVFVVELSNGVLQP